MEEVKIDRRKIREVFYTKYTEEYKPTLKFKETFLNRVRQEVENNRLNHHRLNALTNLMRKVGKWENKYDKDVYDFSLSELKGMLKEFNSTSELSLLSQKSNLEMYLLFAKSQNMGNLNVPSTIDLTIEDMREMVNPIGSEARYIDRNDLYDIVYPYYEIDKETGEKKFMWGLENACDRVLMLLVFEGVMGRANVDLINLKWRDFDYTNRTLKVNDSKTLKLSDELAEQIQLTIDQPTYLLNNGQWNENTRRKELEMWDKYDTPFLFRSIKEKDIDEDGKPILGCLTPQTIQRRVLASCKEWLDRPYLTVNSLYISGLVDRGVRYTKEVLRRRKHPMGISEWKEWLEQNDEHVNIQDTHRLYKDAFERLAEQEG